MRVRPGRVIFMLKVHNAAVVSFCDVHLVIIQMKPVVSLCNPKTMDHLMKLL